MKTWEYQSAKRSKEKRCLHPLPSFVQFLNLWNRRNRKKSILWNRGNKRDYELRHNIKKFLRSLGKQTLPFFVKLFFLNCKFSELVVSFPSWPILYSGLTRSTFAWSSLRAGFFSYSLGITIFARSAIQAWSISYLLWYLRSRSAIARSELRSGPFLIFRDCRARRFIDLGEIL